MFILFSLSHLHTAVSLLTYLLTKKELTPEEVVGVLLDVVGAGVDTVSVFTDNLKWYYDQIFTPLIF